jgi:hypothetical protein
LERLLYSSWCCRLVRGASQMRAPLLASKLKAVHRRTTSAPALNKQLRDIFPVVEGDPTLFRGGRSGRFLSRRLRLIA